MTKRLGFLIMLLALALGSIVAQVRVKGVVVSQTDGEPLIGVNVMVSGQNLGTVTDIDGQFELTVPNGQQLIVSYVGMTTQTLDPKPTMKIFMREEKQLEEVVVTGLSKMDRRLFTGATTQIKADESLLSGVADVSRSLEGRSAGVSVQNVSGTFGTAPKIRVRGATSIYGSSKPLWVVDGIIMEDVTDIDADALSSGDAETLISSAIAGLSSDDIESFQILKDGSATSIYGARAMAGVIVITTKKGRAGQAHINYTGEYTTRLRPQYSQFNILNSQDQMAIYQEMRDKGWLTMSNLLNAQNYGVYGKMYELENTYNAATGQFALLNTPEAENAYLRNAEMRNTDWFEQLFNVNLMQNHSLSLSGGTDKSTYYASLSAMMDPGWYKQSEVKRYTMNVNVTHNLLENLSINLLGSASYRNQRAPGTISQSTDVVSGEVSRDFDINPFSYALNSSRVLDPSADYVSNYASFNIFRELDNNYIDMNVVNTRYQMELKYKPIQDLEISAIGAIKYDATTQEHKTMDDSNQAEAYRSMKNSQIRDANRLLYTDPDYANSLPISVLPNGGIYQRTDNRMVAYDFRASATYNKTIANTHILNLFAGTEVSGNNRSRTWFNGWGLQYSQGEIPFYTYQFFKKSIEENSDYYSVGNTRYRSAAFFGNATYSYRGKYTANGTLRYEGTNQMGMSRNARWLPTWNMAGSWNVHEEDFFENLMPTLSHLTLKASYSLTGDRVPAGISNSTVILMSYNSYRPNAGDKESGIAFQELENKNLTYEKKHELNIGFEAGFLANRINVEADFYSRDNFDLIGPTTTQGVGGQITCYANMAAMKSWGQEFTISAHAYKSKNFNWNTSFIFSHNENEITELNSASNVMSYVSGAGFAKVGYPNRALYSIPFKGLDENGYPTFLNQDGYITRTDVNFQERENTDFLIYEGPTDPTYTGSFSNIFTYKNWKLNIFLTYSMGNVLRLDPVFSAQYTDMSSMTKEFKNRWMMPGDENVTDIPVILSYREYATNSSLKRAYNAYNYSDIRVAKGDFIRLKEISVSYDFPKNLLDKTPIANASIKMQGTDLMLLYADKKLNGQDPEYCRVGGVSAPMPKQFTMTLKVGF